MSQVWEEPEGFPKSPNFTLIRNDNIEYQQWVWKPAKVDYFQGLEFRKSLISQFKFKALRPELYDLKGKLPPQEWPQLFKN